MNEPRKLTVDEAAAIHWFLNVNIPEQLTRALSMRQPHLEAVLRGLKPDEYRTWHTNIRERVYLYAPQQFAETDYPAIEEEEILALPRGVIVGSVDIVSCRWDEGRGCFAIGMERPTRYAEPIKAAGVPQPGFWRPRF